ncbi:helix-turn-helix domain-containing protein [Marinivivus vitaminiproducens]|uniref:helix-turn-helix domain-containing protein n=1 Tax=Marinivivus vitaminiproducens TaxID=3035935 RepID=UPI00279ACE80|nr:AraC family transcriptional regulator [Geminicoccaceae bacterium SCSIO 64248]
MSETTWTTCDDLRPVVGSGCLHARQARATPSVMSSWADGRIRFDCRSWRCADAECCWVADHHLLVLTDTGGTALTEVRVEDGMRYDGRDRPGVMTFIPAHAERRCAYRHADLRYTALWIDPALAAGITGGACPPTPRVNGADDIVAPLLRDLRASILAGQPMPLAYVEHLVALILIRLAHGTATPPATARPAALSGAALRRVRDYVEAHLDQDLSLATLAAVAGMPVDRFARRFRAATGQAPYAYVLERRVRRGERLLAEPEGDIATIALRLGFSSQSHFTSAFRRRVGTTPASYRTAFLPGS